jgi:pyruvate/2-oxoglutarate dehydrogenase complex dihydrolipoamide dehydrogenase (E3) component
MSIKEASFDAKTIAIVGGGYIGTELAEALSRRGFKTSMISGRRHILGHYVDGILQPKFMMTSSRAAWTCTTTNRC